MAKTKQEIINNIRTYISNSNTTYPNWHIGIAQDPEKCLFNDHNIQKENSWWIYSYTGTGNIAREIEKYFLDLGCKGGDTGGDKNSKHIYAYKITK